MVTTVKGVAQNVQWGTEAVERKSTIKRILAPNLPGKFREEPRLDLRVRVDDAGGNSTEYVSVQASADSRSELPDFIADGDEVEVTGTVESGLLLAHELTNLTTDTTVTL